MKKDFQKWHSKKKEVHNDRPHIFFKEREIWFCYLGENIGFDFAVLKTKIRQLLT